MNILAVAEKPSVAKELASILSNNRAGSRQGRSPYNRIFECNNVEFRGLFTSLDFTCLLFSSPYFSTLSPPLSSFLYINYLNLDALTSHTHVSTGQRSKMSITSVSGHLCEEDFGAEYKWYVFEFTC